LPPAAASIVVVVAAVIENVFVSCGLVGSSLSTCRKD
jgi:hypothetical protein